MYAPGISQGASRKQKHTRLEFSRNFGERFFITEVRRVHKWARDSKAHRTSNFGELSLPLLLNEEPGGEGACGGREEPGQGHQSGVAK